MIENKENAMQRYVDILTNAGFKAVFGDRKNKEVVISILNTLLPPHRQLKDIQYLPTEHQGPTLENKEFRFDFMCSAVDGTVFLVETQCYNDDYWCRRCVSYASRMYNMQSRKGDEYDVAPVYMIGLMGVDVFHRDHESWNNRYISEYTFREKETHDLLDETIIIIFAEIARFNKSGEECVTDLDRMCYLLKNSGKLCESNLKNQPEWLKRQIYTKILRACELAKFSKAKRIQYDKDMYDEKRFNGELYTARREGKAEAIKTMIAAGVPIETIAQAFGMTVEECSEIK